MAAGAPRRRARGTRGGRPVSGLALSGLNGVVESGCRNTNSGTGVTSREGGGDSGHVYESLVLAGLALLNYNKRAMG